MHIIEDKGETTDVRGVIRAQVRDVGVAVGRHTWEAEQLPARHRSSIQVCVEVVVTYVAPFSVNLRLQNASLLWRSHVVAVLSHQPQVADDARELYWRGWWWWCESFTGR